MSSQFSLSSLSLSSSALCPWYLDQIPIPLPSYKRCVSVVQARQVVPDNLLVSILEAFQPRIKSYETIDAFQKTGNLVLKNKSNAE